MEGGEVTDWARGPKLPRLHHSPAFALKVCNVYKISIAMDNYVQNDMERALICYFSLLCINSYTASGTLNF